MQRKAEETALVLDLFRPSQSPDMQTLYQWRARNHLSLLFWDVYRRKRSHLLGASDVEMWWLGLMWMFRRFY